MAVQTGSQKRLNRLGKILKIFMEKGKVKPPYLVKTLQITLRTIQRDILLLRNSGFPISDSGRGFYELDKNLFKGYEIFDDTELALVVALKHLVNQLGEPFQKAADGIFNRLYQSSMALPVFVKIDESVNLDGSQLNRIIKAIREKKQVCFQYKVHSPYDVTLEPYKVAYFDGYWYLIGKDKHDDCIKKYALDKMKEMKMTKVCFKCPPETLDQELADAANVWFSANRNLEVSIIVDKECADYFRRRKVFPTQEILEEYQDGSMKVGYKVGHFEEIKTILKCWIPHIRILEPDSVQE